MAGVRTLGQRSAAVFAGGSGDQRACGVGRRHAGAVGDECRGGSDEEKERCDGELHGDDFGVLV